MVSLLLLFHNTSTCFHFGHLHICFLPSASFLNLKLRFFSAGFPVIEVAMDYSPASKELTLKLTQTQMDPKKKVLPHTTIVAFMYICILIDIINWL